MIRVIVTDSNTCCIYNYQKDSSSLTLHKKLQHLENKLKTTELVSDSKGQYKTDGSAGHGSFTQPTDPKEIKIDRFAREISKELDAGRTRNEYDSLVLIAAPHIHGLINSHLNKHVKEQVTHAIQKDLLHLSSKELLSYLQDNTKYSN